MAIFVDIFMAAILLLALVLGLRQGFVQSLARVAIVIVALLGAAWLAQQLAEPAAKWLEPLLTERIQQKLSGQAVAVDDPSLAAAGLLETFGFSGDVLDELVQSVTDKAQEMGQTLLNAVVSTVLHSVAYAVVYLLSFLLLLLVLRLLLAPLHLFTKLPVVHGVNAILGGALGLVITVTVMLAIKGLNPTIAISAILIAQLLVAAAIDYFGWMGQEKMSFDWRQWTGVGLMLTGVLFMKWR